jgi:copper chaperone CopZ
VVSDTISLAENKALVTYDPERIDLAGIVRAIEDVGYKAEPVAQP